MLATLGFAFVAGLVTVLSPCVLPLLPVLMASAAGEGRARPLGVVVGFVGCFTLATLALGLAVRALGIPPDANRLVAGWLLVGLGLMLTVPVLGEAFERAASLAVGRLPASRRLAGADGFGGGLAAGCGLGLAWSPCVGPIMASVITLALNRQVGAEAVAVTLAFSLGTALPMAAAMLGGRRLLARFGTPRRNALAIRRGFGLLTLLVGLAILTGWDRQAQVALLTWFPNWDAALTGWEARLGF